MAIKPTELNIESKNEQTVLLNKTIEYIDSLFNEKKYVEFKTFDKDLDKHLNVFEVIFKLDIVLHETDIQYIINEYLKEGWKECNLWYNHWIPGNPNTRFTVSNDSLIFQLVKE